MYLRNQCLSLLVSSNPAHGEVYSIQHCVIKCLCNLRQVMQLGFPRRGASIIIIPYIKFHNIKVVQQFRFVLLLKYHYPLRERIYYNCQNNSNSNNKWYKTSSMYLITLWIYLTRALLLPDILKYKVEKSKRRHHSS